MDNRDNRIKIQATMQPCVRATAQSVGYDLRATNDFEIGSQQTLVVPTGVYLDIPADTYAMVCSRSGLACIGVVVANAPGIIDPDYKDEIKVILFNQGQLSRKFETGDKIAQLVFAKTLLGPDVVAMQRTGGLGSTG